MTTTVLLAGANLVAPMLQRLQQWRATCTADARLQLIVLDSARPNAAAVHAATALAPEDAAALARQWPARTPDLHRLALDHGRVQLLLADGDAARWLRDIDARIDAFHIDTRAFDIDARALCRLLARLAAPRAALVASPALPAHALVSAGFALAGDTAVYAPNFQPRGRSAPPRPAPGEVLIVGAGLAGCAAAWALAEQGWRCTVFDRHAEPASEASGNPAGLFHGTVNEPDGVHARFNRAAALAAQRAVRVAIDAHGVSGSTDGLLRLDFSAATAQALRELIARLRLPPEFVQALDAAAASARCGLPLAHPAWFFPGGGWVQPAGLARSFLARAGDAARFVGGAEVHALRRESGRWRLLDAGGRTLGSAGHVVLANAGDAQRLAAQSWPLQRQRGQLSLLPNPAGQLRLPRVPLAGAGYLLPEVAGFAVFGATSQRDDADAAARDSDHRFNLERLQRLSAQPLAPAAAELQARVAWRCAAADRLPLVGALVDEATAERGMALRALPRLAGLYTFCALGSRGITWAALGAQLLAAQMSGGVVERRLADALDPARFRWREMQRG